MKHRTAMGLNYEANQSLVRILQKKGKGVAVDMDHEDKRQSE